MPAFLAAARFDGGEALRFPQQAVARAANLERRRAGVIGGAAGPAFLKQAQHPGEAAPVFRRHVTWDGTKLVMRPRQPPAACREVAAIRDRGGEGGPALPTRGLLSTRQADRPRVDEFVQVGLVTLSDHELLEGQATG